MFKKILIANRGEIALRIIRACRELNISTVAVYSTVDEVSLHTKFADEAICIGPGDSKNSYLKIDSIISAAELTDADAIHPGYGFLAENSKFSEICKENNFHFIGPNSNIISLMGNKSKAKELMKSSGVPVVPGNNKTLNDSKDAICLADKIGYPIMLKASSGGGGKGMRVVKSREEVESAFNIAKEEAISFFNDDEIYIEKFISNPRHIEIQIMGDINNNIISFGERECSIQRRHQKLIEESPSPYVDDELRMKMSEAAIRGAKAVNYIGAGTVEFLVDDYRNFYFMEMNTRIQVEHPVTEMVTSQDLIKTQILCHYGMPLSPKLRDIKFRGHSIECRINAEDPFNGFCPSPGKITSLHMPGGMGVRVDTHLYSGYIIPPNYDSMIAKIIVHAPSRIEAINRMSGALDECVIEGINTTIPFHKKILSDKNFISGNFTTGFLDNFIIEKEI